MICRKNTCVLNPCPNYPTTRNVFQRYTDKILHKAVVDYIFLSNSSAFLVPTTLSWPHHGRSNSPPLMLGLTRWLALNDGM